MGKQGRLPAVFADAYKKESGNLMIEKGQLDNLRTGS